MTTNNNPRDLSIRRYEGKTFVAFLDLSGFKKMMIADRKKAEKALGRFYQTIYSVAQNNQNTRNNTRLLEVDSIVVSDCAVIFSRITHNRNSSSNEKILRNIRCEH